MPSHTDLYRVALLDHYLYKTQGGITGAEPSTEYPSSRSRGGPQSGVQGSKGTGFTSVLAKELKSETHQERGATKHFLSEEEEIEHAPDALEQLQRESVLEKV